jgi:glycosyltransferase involved in cell wall biosynthesis
MAERAARSRIRRVHVLAFRDLDHPEAGGSEVHATHVCAELAAAGLEVTLRTSAVPGAPEEIRRGSVRVVRRGGRLGVFPGASWDEGRHRLGPSDGIIEVFHGIPFLTPLWARRTPQVAVIHHVNIGNWHNLLAFPGSAVGHVIERFVVPRAYRRRELITLAASPRAEVLRAYRSDPARTRIGSCGVDPAFSPGGKKADEPLVVAVARMMPAKAIPELVAAFALARRDVPDARLVLVGDGPARPEVEAAVRARHLTDAVELAGHVDLDGLVDWYRRAWVVASASTREGYGLTFIEAGACGTPAVASRIDGHVDAIVDGTTGLLGDDTAQIGTGLARVLREADLRARLGAGARARAAEHRWDHTAHVILGALCDDADRRR